MDPFHEANVCWALFLEDFQWGKRTRLYLGRHFQQRVLVLVVAVFVGVVVAAVWACVVVVAAVWANARAADRQPKHREKLHRGSRQTTKKSDPRSILPDFKYQEKIIYQEENANLTKGKLHREKLHRGNRQTTKKIHPTQHSTRI
jgi:type VI protein secretion system component VasK